MHEGVDREGRQLYPAFPMIISPRRPSEDIHALYAFLMSRPAVRNVIPANELNFPFNFRPLVAGWKLLFLSQAALEPDASKSAEWNRGRYLVEGLGHCGSCHTPRNALGGEKKGSAYAGGVAEGWNAPPLNASLVSRASMDRRSTCRISFHRLASAARRGCRPDGGCHEESRAGLEGRMSTPSPSTSQPLGQGEAAKSAPPANGSTVNDAPAEVVAIYNGACAKCHNDRNDVGPSKALPLSLSTAVHQAESANTVRVILHGIQSYRTRRRALHAGVRRHSDRQADRLTRPICARALHRPAAMDRRQRSRSRKQDRKELSHDDLSEGQWQIAATSMPTLRRRCFMSCATISACTDRNSAAGSANAAPAWCMSTDARRSRASCRLPRSADREITTLKACSKTASRTSCSKPSSMRRPRNAATAFPAW